MKHFYSLKTNFKNQIDFFRKSILFFSISLVSLTSFSQVCVNANTTIFGLDASGNIYPITVSNASVGAQINRAPHREAKQTRLMPLDMIIQQKPIIILTSIQELVSRHLYRTTPVPTHIKN
jgi:hypothetical protein